MTRLRFSLLLSLVIILMSLILPARLIHAQQCGEDFCVYLPTLLKNFDPNAPTMTATPTRDDASTPQSSPTATPTPQNTPTINPTPIPTVVSPTPASVANSQPIDLTISLYKTATGDDRTSYETILGYFADGIYEMTNGAFIVRTITIYQNGQFSDKASVVWTAQDWPRASLSGYGGSGQVKIGDVFPFPQPYNALQAGNEPGAGYTLAHEWGHFQFGLRDEYAGTTTSDDPGQPQAGDTTIQTSIMGGGNWNAVNQQFSYLNFSTAQDYTQAGTTAQHRYYNASGWDTVARAPSQDPRAGERTALQRQDYSAQLKDVKSDSTPSVELPNSAARSALNITWASPDATAAKLRHLVIDVSAEMGTNNRLSSIKTAAKNYVNKAQPGDMLGLITYADGQTTVQQLITIDNEATKTALKAKIDSLTVSASTNRFVVPADQTALQDLVNNSPTGVVVDKSVSLFVSGRFADDGNPYQTLLDNHTSAGIPLNVFDFSPPEAGVANILQQVANFTNGKYTYVGGDTGIDLRGRLRSSSNPEAAPQDIIEALEDHDQYLSAIVDVNLGTIVGTLPVIPANTADNAPIFVDSTLDGLEVLLAHDGVISDANITLEDPDGIQDYPPECETDVEFGETICYFYVIDPVDGEWLLNIETFTNALEIDYRATGFASDGYTYWATLESVTGESVVYPEPILLVASLSLVDPIAKAAAFAYVEGPDGQDLFPDGLRLKDDGVAPDVEADDGFYTAFLPYNKGGSYYVTFIFDNIDDEAVFTQRGFEHTPGPNYEQDFPDDRKVEDDFDRFATLELFVNDFKSDDHADTVDLATELRPNNENLPGRIDRPGDVDSFQITATEAMTMAIRVSDVGLGLKANIKLINQNGSEENLVFDNPAAGNFTTTIPLDSFETIYVQLSHIDDQAVGGVYQISAGAPLSVEE